MLYRSTLPLHRLGDDPTDPAWGPLVARALREHQGQLESTASAVASLEVPPHNLLASATHLDTTDDSPTRGSLIYGNATPNWDELVIGAADRFLGSDGTDVAWTAPGALTRVNDTNVTLSFSAGTPTTALLRAVEMTLGWSGQLAVTRGGTGLATVAQGDLLYGSAADTLARLTKDANATRYLSNTGASNNPAWAQVNLANGVSGDLPFANLTQIAGLSVLGVTGASTADVAGIAGTAGQFLKVNAGGTALAFETLTGLPSGAFATPAANSVLITSPTAGSAATAMRSDATLQLSQAIAPTWTEAHTFRKTLTIAPTDSAQRLVRLEADASIWAANVLELYDTSSATIVATLGADGVAALGGLSLLFGSFSAAFTATLTANRTYSFPDISSTVVMRTGTESISGQKTMSNMLHTGGKINTSVEFRDDTDTTKELGMDLTLIMAATRQWRATNNSGHVCHDGNVVVDDAGTIVTLDGDVVVS